MVQEEIIDIAKRYKDYISNYFHFDNLYLFGSYSKGSQKKYSDIDIAVVVKSFNGDYMTIVQMLWKLRIKIDSRIEPILIIQDKDQTGFFEEIIKTGIEIN